VYLYHGVFDTQRGGEEDARSEVLKEVENGKGDARARKVLVKHPEPDKRTEVSLSPPAPLLSPPKGGFPNKISMVLPALHLLTQARAANSQPVLRVSTPCTSTNEASLQCHSIMPRTSPPCTADAAWATHRMSSIRTQRPRVRNRFSAAGSVAAPTAA
jgi:hypothetical protein